MATERVLYVGNPNIVEVGYPHPLTNELTGFVINDADIEAELLDGETAEVVVATFPVAYVADSKGGYRGVIPASAPLVAHRGYRLVIRLIDDPQALWDLRYVARARG